MSLFQHAIHHFAPAIRHFPLAIRHFAPSIRHFPLAIGHFDPSIHHSPHAIHYTAKKPTLVKSRLFINAF